LYIEEVKRLHDIFLNNDYPDWFFNKAIRKFQEQCNNFSNNEKYEKDFLFTIGIPYFIGKVTKLFAKRLCAIVKAKFCVDIYVYYKCFKTGSYFQLKCSALFPLMSNVTYKFSCLLDAKILYTGMTTRHLGIRVQEPQNLKIIHKRPY